MSADPAPHLPPIHVCPGCGLVHSEWARAVRSRDEDIANLEAELRGKRAAITRLKGEGKVHEDADDVLGYWSEVLSPKAKELTGARRKAASDRLFGGYTADELKRCVDGYALKPYVVNGRRSHEGPKDARHVDPTLIFRDAKHVQMGLDILERADDLRSVMDPAVASEGTHGALLGPLGRAALRMAQFGFAVFPLKARAKDPATRHGCLDAKRDLELIERTWAKHPQANIGVATGQASGVVVLDVDTDSGSGRDGMESLLRLEDEFDELPRTASVNTPSGGTHYYLQAPSIQIHNTVDFPGPGLDIRGDGGYVVAPPSVAASGKQYEVDEAAPPVAMPPWLLEKLTGYQAKLANMVNGANPADDYVAMINSGVPAGQRNDATTRYVGHLFNFGMDPREVRATVGAVNQRCKPPMSPREIDTIVKSISRRNARQ